MNDKRNERKGVTLIEVMIVAAIVMVLLGVLWLAIGPSIRRKALEVRITSDLHQIALAYNMYVTDWEGKYPRGMSHLSPALPQGFAGDSIWSAMAPHYAGPKQYRLWHTQQDEDDMDRLGANLRWQPQENCVVVAEFLERNTGGKMMGRLYGPGGTYRPIEQDAYTVPCALIDGAAAWRHPREYWLQELAVRRAFGR